MKAIRCLLLIFLTAVVLLAINLPSYAGDKKIMGVIKSWQQAVFQLQPDTGPQTAFFNKPDTKYPNGHPNAGERVSVSYYLEGPKHWATRVTVAKAAGHGPHLNGVVKDWKPAVFQLQPDTGPQRAVFTKPDTSYPDGHPKAGARVRVFYYLQGEKAWATLVELL